MCVCVCVCVCVQTEVELRPLVEEDVLEDQLFSEEVDASIDTPATPPPASYEEDFDVCKYYCGCDMTCVC